MDARQEPDDFASAAITNLSEFRALARLLRCGVVLLDARHSLRFASAGGCRLLGFESERALRRHWKSIVPHLNCESLAGLVPGGEPVRARVELTRERDAARQLRLEAHAVPHRDGTHFLLLLKSSGHLDASDLPILLASQARVQEHVLAGYVHDINGPLNNFNLTLTLLEASLARAQPGSIAPDIEARWKRHLEVLRSEMGRLTHWARELAAVALPLQPGAGRVDMTSLWRDVHRALSHEATVREIALEVDVPSRALWVIGDAGLIRLAALSFLICLIDVTAPGGSIRVMVEPDAREGRAIVGITARGGHLPDEVMREFYRLMFVPESDFIGLIAGRLIIEQQGGEAALRGPDDGRLGVELRLPVPSY